MAKIYRDEKTALGKSFWQSAEKAAEPVREWPSWRRAGINVSLTRLDSESQSEVLARDEAGPSRKQIKV